MSRKNSKPHAPQPSVSVVIVNWNGRKWLEKCLDSLINQTYAKYNIIVVDNASADDSVSFIRGRYRQKVHVVESLRNLGFAGGNNLGINQATGELLLLLNNDTWVERDFLTRLITSYKEQGVDVLAAQEATYDTKEIHPGTMTIDLLGHPVVDKREIRSAFYLQGACLLFAKKLYQETHGLDDGFFMYFEETDWFWRLQLLGKTIGQDDTTCFYHAGAGSAGGGMNQRTFLWRNQNTLQMLLKNYRLATLIWVIPLYLLQNLIEMTILLLLLRPSIAYTYLKGIAYNMRNLPKIMKKRRWVQQHRIYGDMFIIAKMYHGPGKLAHALRFIRHEY